MCLCSTFVEFSDGWGRGAEGTFACNNLLKTARKQTLKSFKIHSKKSLKKCQSFLINFENTKKLQVQSFYFKAFSLKINLFQTFFFQEMCSIEAWSQSFSPRTSKLKLSSKLWASSFILQVSKFLQKLFELHNSSFVSFRRNFVKKKKQKEKTFKISCRRKIAQNAKTLSSSHPPIKSPKVWP